MKSIILLCWAAFLANVCLGDSALYGVGYNLDSNNLGFLVSVDPTSEGVIRNISSVDRWSFDYGVGDVGSSKYYFFTENSILIRDLVSSTSKIINGNYVGVQCAYANPAQGNFVLFFLDGNGVREGLFSMTPEGEVAPIARCVNNSAFILGADDFDEEQEIFVVAGQDASSQKHFLWVVNTKTQKTNVLWTNSTLYDSFFLDAKRGRILAIKDKHIVAVDLDSAEETVLSTFHGGIPHLFGLVADRLNERAYFLTYYDSKSFLLTLDMDSGKVVHSIPIQEDVVWMTPYALH